MDLRETRVGESGPQPVRPPGCRDVATLGVGRQVEDIGVAARGKYHRVRRMRLDLAGHHVARDDAARPALHEHQIEHLGAWKHRHFAGRDLAGQCLVGAEQKLLTSLPAGIEGTRDLRPAERAIGEIAAVLASKGNPLRHALVDDAG